MLKDNVYRHHIVEITSLTKKFDIKSSVVKNLKEALKTQDYFKKFLNLSDNNIHTYSHTFHVVTNGIKKYSNFPKIRMFTQVFTQCQIETTYLRVSLKSLSMGFVDKT